MCLCALELHCRDSCVSGVVLGVVGGSDVKFPSPGEDQKVACGRARNGCMARARK